VYPHVAELEPLSQICIAVCVGVRTWLDLKRNLVSSQSRTTALRSHSMARYRIHRIRSISKSQHRKNERPLSAFCGDGVPGQANQYQPGSTKMKNLKTVSALIAALMLTAVAGCASTAKQESTGQYVDDTVITTSVKAAILNEPSLKVSEINVETFKGVVQLSGFVRSQDNIATAVNVTRGVNGVRSVKNDMRLK
jgi:osmotically-inducible protein OsmY